MPDPHGHEGQYTPHPTGSEGHFTPAVPPGGHAEGPDAHHGPTATTYTMVFIALCVFTTVSFAVNFVPQLLGAKLVGTALMFGAGVIMVVAVIKAFLVGSVFMHLKYDWNLLYFLIVPAFVLGTMMMIVLMPDLVLCWQPYE